MAEKSAWRKYIDDLIQGVGTSRYSYTTETSGVAPGEGAMGEDLSKVSKQYQTNQQMLSALGKEEPKKKGFLSTALGILDKPRAIVFSAGKELADVVGGGDASWSDFTRQVREGYGAGDIQLLKMREGDSGWMRALKGAGAFAGDVLADPLTYVSFGTAGIAKKAAIDATEAVAKRGLREVSEKVGAEGLERLATRGLDDAARATLLEAGEEAVFEKAAQNLAGDMATGYAKSRSRGLLDTLKRELGDDVGLDFFENSVPSAMQGGITLRLPFKKDEFGLAKVVGIGKGGTLSEATGVAKVLDTVSEAKGAIRFADNKIGRVIDGTIKALGGRDGEAYAKAMRSLYKNDPALGGFYEYNALKAATKKKATLLAQLQKDTGSVVGVLHDFAYKKGADPRAKELVKKYFLNRAALAEAADTTLSAAERELDDQARAIATKLTDTFDMFAKEAEDVFGDDFDKLDNYVPLMMSKEAKDALKETTPATASRGGREWKALKSREKFYTLEADADGVLRRRWMNPAEANARLKTLGIEAEDIFETDPLELMVNYAEGMSRALSQRRFLKELRDRGVLTTVARKAELAGVNPERVVTAAENLDELALSAGIVDGVFSPEDFIAEFNKVLDATKPDDLDRVGDMVNTIIDLQGERVRSTIAAGVGATGKAAREAENAVAAARESLSAAREAAGVIAAKREAIARGLVGEEASKFIARSVGSDADILRFTKSFDEAGRELAAKGMRQVGQGVENVMVPESLQDTFATNLILDSVNKLVTLNAKGGDAGIREAYDNYMRFWRASATFGRGPGFAIRNAQSGLWQNFVVGVTGRDYLVSNAIVQGRRQALKEAEKEGAARGAVLAGSDLEKFVDDYLREKLSKVKVGRGNAYDVYVAARDEGQVFDDFVVLPAFEGEDLTSGVKRYTGAEMSIIDPNKSKEELGKLGRVANVVAGNNPLGKTTKALNSTAEQYLRVAAVANGVRKYGADEAGQALAAMLMKGAHFDYSNLSDFERKYMRNILPFYTWTRNSIPQGFRALLFDPGKVNAFFRANENAQEAFGTDEAMYKEWLPEWIDEKFGWALGTKIAGNQLSISPEAAILDINKFFGAGGVPDVQEFLSGLSPVVKAPIEALTKKDLFTGASYREEGIETPGWMRPFANIPGVSTVLGTRVGEEGEQRVTQTFPDLLREAVPAIGSIEKFIPGAGGPRDAERRLSSALSQFLGAPVSTLSERQLAGELRSRNADINLVIESAIGELGLDRDLVREAVKRFGPELTADYIAEGWFRRQPVAE